MAESKIYAGLYELVKHLTEAGFKMTLWPLGGVGQPIDYAVDVQVDGLTPDQLEQLLAIIGSSEYDGSVKDGWLVLKS